MAAVAYDVAALALKGREAELNFPSWAASLPVPASTSPRDIQAAAASAAAAAGAAGDGLLWSRAGERSGNHRVSVEGDDSGVVHDDGFVDEEMLFNMPNVIANMAEGMLLSPPNLDVSRDDGGSEGGGSHNLWRFP
ncbi:AP2/ERF domain-containing protein [Psidium guajava]|nr:AP2/ERF domain-containing protein [Psidium guajava]